MSETRVGFCVLGTMAGAWPPRSPLPVAALARAIREWGAM